MDIWLSRDYSDLFIRYSGIDIRVFLLSRLPCCVIVFSFFGSFFQSFSWSFSILVEEEWEV